MAKISLSDFRIKTPIDELAKDIECQDLKKLQAKPFFSIQCDHTTDVSRLLTNLAADKKQSKLDSFLVDQR